MAVDVTGSYGILKGVAEVKADFGAELKVYLSAIGPDVKAYIVDELKG